MILAVNIAASLPVCARRASTDETVEERIPMFTKYMGAALHGQGHSQKSAVICQVIGIMRHKGVADG